jgi:hypothetical protein
MARPGGGILFPQRFHAGLKDGSVTRTIRAWSKLQIKVGGRYRLDPTGVLEVMRIDETTVGALGPDDAVRGGFESLDAVLAELKRVLREPPSSDRTVFRIDLRWIALPDPRLTLALEDDLTPEVAQGLVDRLDAMDGRSRKGPWTWLTLGLITVFPRVSARVLAPKLGGERLPFKNDVRKLKELGLTYSRETGYDVTPRGIALLAWEAERHR